MRGSKEKRRTPQRKSRATADQGRPSEANQRQTSEAAPSRAHLSHPSLSALQPLHTPRGAPTDQRAFDGFWQKGSSRFPPLLLPLQMGSSNVQRLLVLLTLHALIFFPVEGGGWTILAGCPYRRIALRICVDYAKSVILFCKVSR